LGMVASADISKSEDEYELIQRIQALIGEQVHDLSNLHTKIYTFEQEKPATTTEIEKRMKDFKKLVVSLRDEVVQNFEHYLRTSEIDTSLTQQLKISIQQLTSEFQFPADNFKALRKGDGFLQVNEDLRGDMDAAKVVHVMKHQLKSCLEDQIASFSTVLQDMSELTSAEDEEQKVQIDWEPMQQDLEDLEQRLRSADPLLQSPTRTLSPKTASRDVSVLTQWIQDIKLLFSHQRSLLHQLTHEVVSIEEQDLEGIEDILGGEDYYEEDVVDESGEGSLEGSEQHESGEER